MKKNKPLEVGQVIWIQQYPVFYKGESSLYEYQVIEVNNSSAYAIRIEDVGRDKKHHPIRIDQKKRNVRVSYSAGYGFKMWETRDEYLEYRSRLKEEISLKEVAINKVKAMSLDELREFTKS